jgi:hypothetical protein
MGVELCLSDVGELMDNDDWDHFVGSVSEQLLLMLWTALFTVGGVGFILMLAL